MQATNLIFLSCKKLCNVLEHRELRLNLAPHGVDVVEIFGALLCLQRLLQVVKEIRQMIGLLMESKIQLDDGNARRYETVQIARILQQQLDLLVDVIALRIFHVVQVRRQFALDALEFFVFNLQVKFNA